MRRLLPVVVVGLALAATALPAHADGTTTWRAYDVPTNTGEPSIGYDPLRHAAVYTAGTSTYRVQWDDAGTSTATSIKPQTSATSLDAITYTDQATGRTFVSQLLGACSATSYTDDAGKTYQPSQGCGANTLLDHQTFGGGPFSTQSAAASAVKAAATYPDAVYYCAQNSYQGLCAVSTDGGQTFGAGVPAYNAGPANLDDPAADPTAAAQGGGCSAIHGHVRVGPDGTAYLPNKGCGGTPTAGNLTNTEFFGGTPALSVSEDNGTTWHVRKVTSPDAHNADESDPSVDADKGGRVYFSWEDGTNPSVTTYGTNSADKVATTTDHGKTWSTPVDLSALVPGGKINNIKFPEVVAGDAGHAAVAFLGTQAVGNDQYNGFLGADGKPAVWHLYVATTRDGGLHWDLSGTATTNADGTTVPVQRGCIDMQGTSNKTVTDTNICSDRNLLDFNDITKDDQGRVLVAYTQGCNAVCAADPTMVSGPSAAAGRILRSTPVLLATTDPTGPAPVVPEVPAALLLPLAGVAVLLGGVALRRRRTA